MIPATQKSTADLQLAFDEGHSSIGWAVLKVLHGQAPVLLGCGSVIFPADDCLASVRRGFRRQRRHIRATRLRVARLKRLLTHLGVLDDKQLDAPGCAWPWLLAARVLRGGKKLTWSELWDVIRWYAHNRGYDGNKGWSRHDAASAEDTEKEQLANELLDGFHKKHGRAGTMAEVFCDVLGVDPLGPVKSSMKRVRNLGAAFPREGVEAEVERILRAHVGALPQVDERLVEAVIRDYTALPGPDYRLPARYGQRVNGARTPGGLLFGQLVPRFENRIIATCPVQFQRVYDAALEGDFKDDSLRKRFEQEQERLFIAHQEIGEVERVKRAATHVAEVAAKVPGIGCVEFHRFRWAMQLANVLVSTGDARKSRRLSKEERQAVNAEMEKLGAFTPKQFKDFVRALTGAKRDNLDNLLAQDHSGESLILDPARKLAASGVLGVLWPHLGEPLQKHTLTNLRRGKSITARVLLEKRPVAQSAFDHWWDGEAMKTPRKTKKNPAPAPRTRDNALDDPHSLGPMNGRAAHSREVMEDVWKFVLSGDGHPMDPDAPLFRSEAIRRAQLERAIDEQTNNHLVRHRLKLLERLHDDLLKEYAQGHKARIGRITIEVNRNLKDFSGKTAQEQAKTQGQLTAHFRGIEKLLAERYEEAGMKVRLTPELIRKGRIADDLGWKCPYTTACERPFDPVDLFRKNVDKDHIIPRRQRASDSLDSLVITYPAVNKMKGNRTALQFIEEDQGKEVPGMPGVHVKYLDRYKKDVKALRPLSDPREDSYYRKNRIPIDDPLRCWLRKKKLELPAYVEKEFTPGDLTKTSQLVRLGAEALQRAYVDAKQKPVIVSLPGSVTAVARKSWNLAGCLALANPNVLNPEDLDENGHPRVHRKTELRGITHLHHALDASVIAFTSHLLPCDGGVWKREVIELLAKRRCNPTEKAQLRMLLRGHVTFTAEGQPTLTELPKELREQLRARLAERRVVQHLPAEWGGLPTKETVWRVFDTKDDHPNAKRIHRWLKEAKVRIPDPDDPKTTTVLLTMRKRRSAKDEEGGSGGKVFRDTKREWKWVYCEVERSKVLGLGIVGDKKLRAIKGGKLIDDNYGMALFPNAPKGAEKFRPIRFFRVWEEMERLKMEGGGKRPPILRRGHLIRFKTGPHAGKVWRVLGLQDNGLVRFFEPDTVRRIDDPQNYKRLQITGLLKDGLEIVGNSLCGVAPKPTED